LFGGRTQYRYKTPASFDDPDNTDLSIILTTFQDWSNPDLYVKEGGHANTTDYDWSSVAWGMGTVIVSPSELHPQSVYFIDVECYTYCSYSVTASLSEEI
jgi:hypothetical protein